MEEANLSSVLLESAAKMEPAVLPALWGSQGNGDVSQGSRKALHHPATSIKKQISYTIKKQFHNTSPDLNNVTVSRM